jgi:hypothetical protein
MCIFSPEDGGSMFLRNFCMYLRICPASQPRRKISPFLPPWVPQISRVDMSVSSEILVLGHAKLKSCVHLAFISVSVSLYSRGFRAPNFKRLETKYSCFTYIFCLDNVTLPNCISFVWWYCIMTGSRSAVSGQVWGKVIPGRKGGWSVCLKFRIWFCCQLHPFGLQGTASLRQDHHLGATVWRQSETPSVAGRRCVLQVRRSRGANSAGNTALLLLSNWPSVWTNEDIHKQNL